MMSAYILKSRFTVLVKSFGLAALAAAFCVMPAIAESLPEDARSPVLLVGDSMMKLPGATMERQLKREGFEATAYSGIGTGLARLDAFDWLAKMKSLCADVSPMVTVVAIGANDRQPMQLDNGAVVQPGTPEWDDEYARRVGVAMDTLVEGGNRFVIWLLLPPMRDATVDQFSKQLNEVFRSEAAKRPRVLTHDFSKLIADRRTGGFTERVMDPGTGAAVQVREVDGIHLSPNGARMLAQALIREYWK